MRKEKGLVLLCLETSPMGASTSGLGPAAGLVPVTEQPMMRPCRRTPRYHLGPMRWILTSSKPALVNHSMYSSSVGKSIQTSAKKREMGQVGCTGPMRQALPPGLMTRYASVMPRCGSGQYSMLPAETYLSKLSVSKGRSSASPSTMVTSLSGSLALALASWCGDWSSSVTFLAGTFFTTPSVQNPVPPPTSTTLRSGLSSLATLSASSRMSSVQCPGFTT
mmetsp:Transcript_9291/g.23560  ORF Transcript_9291/g.23560 Transcript_9291/m.23560 type:complete len:221 (+) Transcript_9291:120-782(+)